MHWYRWPLACFLAMALVACQGSGEKKVPGQGEGPGSGVVGSADNVESAGGTTAVPDNALATINGDPVGIDEFSSYLDLFVIPEQRTPKEVERGLIGLINNRLLAITAVEKKMESQPAVRGKIGLSANRVWEDAYWTEIVKPTVKISDEEILKEAPLFEDAIRVHQILVSDPEKAEILWRRVVHGKENFEAVARAESEGFSAARGGDLGYIKKGTEIFEKEVLDLLFRLKKGEVTPVTHTRIGYSILKVSEVKPASEWKKEWLESSRAKFAESKAKQVWESHFRALKKKHKVTLNNANGKKLVAAIERKEDLRKFAKLPLLQVDGEKWTAEDIIDPSGAGVIHGPSNIEKIVDSRLKEYLLNAEMDRLGLKKKYPLLQMKERLLRENVLARSLLQEMARDIKVTESDLKKYYKDNPLKFTTPKMLDVSVIEVGSREDAEKALSAVKAGMNFGDAADRFSRKKDLKAGKIGLVPEKQVAPQFAAVLGLKAGEHTRQPLELVDPKTGKKSYVILRVNDVVPPRLMPFGQVNRTDVKKAVIAWKQEEQVVALFEKIKKENKVEISRRLPVMIAMFEKKGSTKGGSHALPRQK